MSLKWLGVSLKWLSPVRDFEMPVMFESLKCLSSGHGSEMA